jgi:CheY-like chemotaxis protein
VTNSSKHIVLLVEDNADDLIFIQRSIRKAGVSISLQHVENGEEAMSYLLAEGFYSDRERYPFPALIITNMKMPRMNGLELLAWIKHQPTLKHLPVLVMSSSEDADEMSKVAALGGSSYFVKTSSLGALTEVVKQMMSFLPPLNQQP